MSGEVAYSSGAGSGSGGRAAIPYSSSYSIDQKHLAAP